MPGKRIDWNGPSRSITKIGGWKVGFIFEPAGGAAPGGDRFALESTNSDAMTFYLADATGHGRRGARFWEWFENAYHHSWQRFASDPSERSLTQFASEFNDVLHQRTYDGTETSVSQLCVAAGWVSNEGALVYAGFGLGVHVIAITAAEARSTRARGSFGFRLGWVPSKDWPQFEGAFAIHHIAGLRRLCLASDAFFGDDHADPQGALAQVEELGRAASALTIEETLSYVGRIPHAGDDATFVVLERDRTGSARSSA